MRSRQFVYKEIKTKILQWVEEDKQRMIELCSALVRCKTVDPPGDTREAMALIEQYMKQAKLPYRMLAIQESLPNLISSVELSGKGRHVMFNGHLDTMPAGEEPGWTDDPWSGKVADGMVWGRGAGDMKGGVAAMLFAYTYVVRLKAYLPGKVSISLVSDEETGYGRGTGYLFEQIPEEMAADCVLSAEPSGTEAVSFASKGYMQYSIRIATPGAIAGYSNDSRSAIRIAADIIRDLDELEHIEITLPPLLAEKQTDAEWIKRHTELRGAGHAEQLRRITTDICTVRGGTLLCVIAPDCTFSATTVIPVGTDPYAVFRKIREIVARYPEAELFWDGIDSADISDPDGEAALLLQDAAEELTGRHPVMTPDIAISDCRYWRYKGTPAYWYGPDSWRCSAADESVSVEEIFHVAATHALVAVKFLMAKKTNGRKTNHSLIVPPGNTDFTAEIKMLPAIRVAYTRHVASGFGDKELAPVIENGLYELYRALNAQGATIGAIGMALYEMRRLPTGYEVDVVTAYPVGNEVIAGDGYEVMVLPSVEAAVAVHRGPLKTIGKTWRELGRWMKRRGLKPGRQYREVYILGGSNPEPLWITEVQQTIE